MFATAGLGEMGIWGALFLVSLVTVVPLIGTVAIYFLITIGYKIWSHNRVIRNRNEH